MIASNRVALNLATLGGDICPRQLLLNMRIASRVGFRCVGLRVRDVESWTKAGRHLRDLARAAKDMGIQVVELCDVNLYERGRVADQTQTFIAAAALGASTVSVMHNSSNVTLEQTRQDWTKFLECISDVEGVRAALHFRGECSRFCTLDAAWDIVGDDPATGAVLIDVFDFWRGRSSARSLDAVPVELIGMVHLADACNVKREHATADHRTFPGRGIIPLTHVVSTLGHRGYSGMFSVEVASHGRSNTLKTAEEAYRCARKLLGTSGPSHRKLTVNSLMMSR